MAYMHQYSQPKANLKQITKSCVNYGLIYKISAITLIRSIPKLDEENGINTVFDTDLYVSSTNFTTCSLSTAFFLALILTTAKK
jgi:hypothetical protein